MIDSMALSAYRETKNHLHQPCSYYLLQDEVPLRQSARVPRSWAGMLWVEEPSRRGLWSNQEHGTREGGTGRGSIKA